MKKTITTSLFVAAASLSFADAWTSTLVGGGDSYYTLDSAANLNYVAGSASNPATLTITTGTNGYKGIDGVINWSFSCKNSSGSVASGRDYNAFTTATNFEFKGTVNMGFDSFVDSKRNDGWNSNTIARYTAQNGSTVKFADLRSTHNVYNSSQMYLLGTGATSFGNFEIATSKSNLNQFGQMGFVLQYSNLTFSDSAYSSMIHFYYNSTLTLNGNSKLTSLYARNVADLKSGVVHMNGYSLGVAQQMTTNSGITTENYMAFDFGKNSDAQYLAIDKWERKKASDYILIQNMGSNDTLLVMAYGESGSQPNKVSFQLEDDLSDFIFFEGRGEKGVDYDVIRSLEKTTITLVDGSTITGYTYYAIPEPSTYAAIFGVLALGFAFYRRKTR